ncbi:MAG TPA: 3-dehydroquinate dehydratase [Ruminiclostridium sp.]|jgi:ABC-2 type transport system ATP-binding protein|nr:3-dehydroquinate dehydratase [Ruminiclostridium sp.]
MLSITNVSKTYSKGKVKAVDNISLDVKPGEIFGFIGPNGAGKTTTIKMITGILPIDEGKITIRGYDIAKEPIKAKLSMGFVPDTHDVYDRLSGIEYLNFIADVYNVSSEERKKQIDKYLEMFEIKDVAGQPIKSYSHGMKQKIILTGALLHDPPLWILDEPLTGLDPKSSHLLKEEMHKHCAKGNTVFFSTHVLEVAEKLCDRIGIINKGKIIAVDTLEELRKSGDESLESIFLNLTEAGGGEHA